MSWFSMKPLHQSQLYMSKMTYPYVPIWPTFEIQTCCCNFDNFCHWMFGLLWWMLACGSWHTVKTQSRPYVNDPSLTIRSRVQVLWTALKSQSKQSSWAKNKKSLYHASVALVWIIGCRNHFLTRGECEITASTKKTFLYFSHAVFMSDAFSVFYIRYDNMMQIIWWTMMCFKVPSEKFIFPFKLFDNMLRI